MQCFIPSVSAPTCEWVLQASPTSCSLQEKPMIQARPSVAKGCSLPGGLGLCPALGASSASTAPGGGSRAGSAAQLAQRLSLAVSLGQLRERLLRLFPSPWSCRETSLGAEERAVRKGSITPARLAEGRAHQQQGQCCSAYGCALPVGPFLTDSASPDFPPCRPPESPGPVRAWCFCCSKRTRAA